MIVILMHTANFENQTFTFFSHEIKDGDAFQEELFEEFVSETVFNVRKNSEIGWVYFWLSHNMSLLGK